MTAPDEELCAFLAALRQAFERERETPSDPVSVEALLAQFGPDVTYALLQAATALEQWICGRRSATLTPS